MNTNFFALAILLTLISSYLNNVSGQRQRCLGNYCSGSHRMGAVCKDGYCVCNSQDYDYNTCLPDVYGCKIEVNSATAVAKAAYKSQQRPTTYSCTPGSCSSTQYEVHILTVYEAEALHRRPPVGENANVNIVSLGKPNTPIVLVLGSYEPVNWILKLPAGISISKVILVAYYVDESSVSGDLNQVKAIERKAWGNSGWKVGWGSDSGGGDTVALLRQVHKRYGVVTSFTSTYRADEWSLKLSSLNGSAKARSPQRPSLAQPTGTSPSLSGCKTIASVLSFLVVTVMIPAIKYVG